MSALFASCTLMLAARVPLARGEAPLVAPRVIHVSKRGPIYTTAEAARLAREGDIVEIEAGDYVADVAVWRQRSLTLRGVNGRPRLIASGAAADEKGIWVIRGDDVLVENVEFIGARVPDLNGAGIRSEGRRLVVRRCRFADNENGILGGRDDSDLEIHNSEFEYNGAGDGYSHNIYVSGRRVVVHGNYIARSRVGQLLKSRATTTFVLYNRLSGEDGTSSYELEFPDGGTAFVIGNLIEQGTRTENWKIVEFGAEGYKFAKNELYLSHNTLVNDRTLGGVFVFAAPGEARVTAINNVSVGRGAWQLHVPAQLVGNVVAGRNDFVDPERFDYRLRRASRVIDSAKDTAQIAASFPLRPAEEYVHPATTRMLLAEEHRNPGAFQTIAP